MFDVYLYLNMYLLVKKNDYTQLSVRDITQNDDDVFNIQFSYMCEKNQNKKKNVIKIFIQSINYTL